PHALLARRWALSRRDVHARGRQRRVHELEGVYRIWAACDVANFASVRVLAKIGMPRESVLRRWAIRRNLAPGAPRDAFLYSWVLRRLTRGCSGLAPLCSPLSRRPLGRWHHRKQANRKAAYESCRSTYVW